MHLYLDIDGVLLTKKNPVAATNSAHFLQFVTTHFTCFWLTTHCKGDASQAVTYLTPYFSSEILKVLEKIQPTNWSTLKTEGIQLASEFFWIEDYPMNAYLQSRNAQCIYPECGRNKRLVLAKIRLSL